MRESSFLIIVMVIYLKIEKIYYPYKSLQIIIKSMFIQLLELMDQDNRE